MAFINGTSGNDNLVGTAEDDYINGLAGNDTLAGGAGNDNLNGGLGNDSMNGGTGNDSYTVDSTTDTITENLNAGTDTVSSSISFTLGANLENLYLLGSSAINGYGNSLDNFISGNTADNYLSGGAGNDFLDGRTGGNDTLVGGAGNDIYTVNSTTDTIRENFNEGRDTVFSDVSFTLGATLEDLYLFGSSAINGYGNSLDNRISGNTANNYLSGGAGNDNLDGGTGGNDTLVGGAGNDIYTVNSTTDTIRENFNEGRDAVFSDVSFTLGANLENLYLFGSSAINGYGNSLDNFISGNTANNYLSGGAGNDYLDGGSGNDSMNGGTGNDNYTVDSTTDTVTENLNAGTDTVDSDVSFTLGANLENLYLFGSSAVNGYGNSLDNFISGNTANNYLSGGAGNDYLSDYSGGNDTLVGGDGNDNLDGGKGNDSMNGGTGNDFLSDYFGGNDTLVGGAGNDNLNGGIGSDSFVFYSPTQGIDTITGFNVTQQDKIEVSASGFGGGLTIGLLSSSQFTIGSAATDASDRFIYNFSTGGLFFDADGTGALGQVQLATLENGLYLSSSDINVIT